VNALDYGWGSKADVGIGSTEFYAAVTVDIGLNVVGAATAALIVAIVLPPAAPAEVVLITFFSAQAAFSLLFPPSARATSVERVNRFYQRMTEQSLYHTSLELATSSPLLR